MNDNIAAISSGSRTNQPISIVRLSGPNAVDIIKKIYKGKIGHDHQITYGEIYDKETLIDEVLVMWFIGKKNKDGKMIYNNYVGEPIIEINCHGGIVVTNKILELLLVHGARLAEPGEFTRRAFLNGKLDLVKADAIHDLIMSKTTRQANASVSRFKGKTSDLLDKINNRISLLIGTAEVNIDYPEYEDVDQITSKLFINTLGELSKEFSEIIRVSEKSRYIFEGVKVAILGKPNVGKSSVLNALLSEEKAIVTDIAGTTRDLVEASYQIDGILFKLIDTAGIRKTDEIIEQMGIKKSFDQIEQADLILHILDPSQENNEFDIEIEKKSKELNKYYIKVMNKSDLVQGKKDGFIYISAIKKEIEDLEKALVENFKNIDVLDERIFSNTRQLSLIKKSKRHIDDALELAKNEGYTFDTLIVDLYDAWDSLEEIKGRANREDLLDTMFSNFCLGK
ncbi:tRNA uridine-5-carboxymethylaminomethyl(34) synthesis GTPase MnmE [Mycoplasma sp. OR1901]|uniref:tRNA uridine-5-carboxymethylaminomethyl(34) synthesis GTPase MnmE n=1 Tax=Mycoplasma sp. OR1901 TaxID=2742195 RepID=UPI0015830397|nr:tRNA uridine-5-carboxymethylaminomethyl(34) synthesis GTPase MnmE [Mycoplasma sp. OR1901]QKT05669.1 tRNA uridine-5-carboxymethylaminomethyl(34) synthesis GTPase MnmE [Mycoplasma sp. OR1901]